MQIYLVGGAVRDRLLGQSVKDRDFVVVGATPEQMLDLGYQQVGKDFPVFLHPDNKQEYALARTERKNGKGYTGFTCYAAADVTLEQDLLRRDLTINAMVEDLNGNVIDPLHAQQDLQNRILRHVSPSFSEDPLRVLRVARFAARFHALGFEIAPETLTLMQTMTAAGDLAELTPERVWQEIDKVLSGNNPEVFFQVLRDIGALKVILPEVDQLFGVPAPAKWHPEIDSGIHTLMVLEQAAKLTNNIAVRFAALTHDLGKALTPPEQWPSHHQHGQKGVALIKQLAKRCKVPNEHRDLAMHVSAQHTNIHNAFELRPSTIISLFDKTDAWRKPERFQQILLTCKADSLGRLGFENIHYPQVEYLTEMLTTANQVSVQAIIAQGIQGAAIKQALTKQRIEQLSALKPLLLAKLEKIKSIS